MGFWYDRLVTEGPLFLLLIGIIGLAFGSFANVLIYRLCDPKAPKFWQGRSLCPKCQKQIAARDNIPLLSFCLLRGKCRWCHRPIGWHYPLVEGLTALSFVLCFVLTPTAAVTSLLLCLIAFSFIVIFFADLHYGLIPDEMLILSGLAGLAISPAYLLIGLATSLGFFLVVLITWFRGMGLGDVKLALVMGLLLGWPNILVALWVAFVSGGLVATLLLLLKKTKLSATIPLGPFLIVGTLIAALWSQELLTLVGVIALLN